MHESLVERLCCPGCREGLRVESIEGSGGTIAKAILWCDQCGLGTPVVEGLPVFTEASPLAANENWFATLEARWCADKDKYATLIQERLNRGFTDLYAAFRPFNESTRSAYRFLDILRAHVSPGDVILDTWCRTGWSGECLAGLFPDQQIISIWEGDHDVLGVRGFIHWLAESERAPNLTIIIANPDHGLPIRSDGVAVVHGLDSIHRYRHGSYVPEVLRVCRDDGVLLFPHVHLSNSEPEPWFDRGCQIHHGTDWRRWLDRLPLGDRQAWVLPELELFDDERGIELIDQCTTSHYNALIIIAPKVHDGGPLRSAESELLTPHSRLVINPLVTVDWHRGRVALEEGGLGEMGERLLERHPAYARRLNERAGQTLTALESEVLFEARTGATVEEIASRCQQPDAAILEVAGSLVKREIVQAAPVSSAMFRLQSYFNGDLAGPTAPATFAQLWAQAAATYGDRPVIRWLEDNSSLSMAEVRFLVDGIRAALGQPRPQRGIAIATSHHPAALLVCWAAWLEGLPVYLPAADRVASLLNALAPEHRPSLLFTDESSVDADVPTIRIDGDGRESLEAWLEPHVGTEISGSEVSAEQTAAVLWTSGTTGASLPVALTQRAICLSGQEMVAAAGWSQERLLCLGPLSMMSGLRNPTVAALQSGSTIVLPKGDVLRLPVATWEIARESNVSVINAVPVWLNQLLEHENRLGAAPSMRQICLTSASLPDLTKEAAGRLGLGVVDYYGLTETGGICLVSSDGATGFEPTRGCLIQIVDEAGELVQGQKPGEIRVRSNQLMSQYLGDPEATTRRLRGGWLYTGDLGYWNENGRLQLVGRSDDLIKLKSGESVHPVTIERLILAHDEIQDVMVAVSAQQQLVAIIVSELAENQVRTTIDELQLGAYRPNEVRKVQSLPRTTLGKPDRAALVAMIDKADRDSSDNKEQISA